MLKSDEEQMMIATHCAQDTHPSRTPHNQRTHGCTKCGSIKNAEMLFTREWEWGDVSNLQGLRSGKENITIHFEGVC